MIFLREIKSLSRPDKPNEQLESLEFYLSLAERGIRKCANSIRVGLCKQMLRDEDAIAFVAHELTLADWRYDPQYGRSKEEWQNDILFCAIKKYAVNGGRVHRNFVDIEEEFAAYIDVDITRERPVNPEDQLAVYDVDLAIAIEKAHLTPSQRECIHLHLFEDLTFREIGTLLNCSHNNAFINYKNGISKLREAMNA